MANEREAQNRDQTLHPDTYMYMQNVGKGGLISVYCGPTVVNQTGQDEPVKYDPQTRQFRECSLEQAVQQCPRANEGDYVVLENPTEDGKSPGGAMSQGRALQKGRKVVQKGPWCESLWPGQVAHVIQGHRLRSNQYLVVMVYNAEEAESGWETNTVAEAQTEHSNQGTEGEQGGEPNGQQQPPKPEEAGPKKKGLPKPDSFAVGTRIVVRGEDVSFFLPCTGVEVTQDERGNYVREAVTLEQLEYCCLIDEDGKKSYPKGPAVVFPKSTQVFEVDRKGRRKWRPIELNTINGIHLKVTADFEGPDIERNISEKRKFREGEELFVTGNTLPIYYPREELQIIEYGQGNRKHFSTAIPKGEGRYVIDRQSGEITLIRGPKMLLADPRRQIPVRRVLSLDEVSLWYPNNAEAIEYNKELANAMAESPSGRSGMVSEGDYRKRLAKRGGLESSASYLASSSSFEAIMDDSYSPEEVGEEGGSGGTISRGTSYTKPRTLVLNTKYDGVPRVEIWPGYAILIVGAVGGRRVVEGPSVELLEYDEKLGHMELSTGKPKTSDKLYKTVYLKIQNNQVGDIVAFESKDHVKGKFKISLRVNFEGESQADKLKWFSVDNYVKYLTDHVRSILAGVMKKHTIDEVKDSYVNIIRDAILGTKPASSDEASTPLNRKRPGLAFQDNGMRVFEVEVLDMTLDDRTIAELLDKAQHQVVQANIEIERAQRDLDATKHKEDIEQQKLRAMAQTTHLRNELQVATFEDKIQLILAQLELDLKALDGEKEKVKVRESIADFQESAKLARAKAESDQILATDAERLKLTNEELLASTKAAVDRFGAAKDGLYEVLVALNREELAVKVAEACNMERFVSGDEVGSAITKVLSAFPTLKFFHDKADEGLKDRSNRLKAPEGVPSK